ncbi:MAG: ADOP family duplicated permease [Candidatus Acidiferrales bacterium]
MPEWKPEILRRLAPLNLAPAREAEIADELSQHLEDRYQELLASGQSEDAAFRAALDELKGEDLLARGLQRVEKNFYREPIVPGKTGTNFFEGILQDVRYALRMLRKSPGFTAVAILTLSVGIGANAAIFSIVNAVLLRPLPFKNPSRLVMVGEGFPSLGSPNVGVSAEDCTIYEHEQKSFQSVGAFQNRNFDLSGREEPERVTGSRVSASIFPMLGIHPLLGRTFTPQDDKPGTNVAILSYGLWQRRYAGNRGIVGSVIELDRIPYTVIGVMPKGFQFPMRGPEGVVVNGNNQPADVWVPLAFTSAELQWNGMYTNAVLGRLEPGVSVQQAQAEADLLARRIERQYPADLLKAFNDAQIHLWVSSLHDEIVSSVQTLLLVLMAAVGMVLLIACANVATLLLSRATSRHRETAIRGALGASRGRLARQMFTESLVLALAGGTIGVLIARLGTSALLSLVPSSVSLPHGVNFGGSVLVFAAVVCCLTTIIFGIAPALQSSAISLQGSLQEAGRSGTAGHARHRLQGAFVIAEFALAFVLLIGAGLLIRSFAKLLQTSPGFQPDNILTMSVPLPQQAYPKATEIRDFYQQLAQRASDLPGVRSVVITSDLPLKSGMTVVMQIQGRPGFTPPIRVTWALGNYFTTMEIPLLKGHFFTPEDRAGSQPVVIISADTAAKFWPSGDAIGKRVEIAGTPGMATIVGVVGDVNDAPLGTTPLPHVYVPYLQVPDKLLEDKQIDFARLMTLAVRTSTDPTAMTSALVGQIHSLDSGLAVAEIRTMVQEVNSSVAGPKFNTFLLGLFGSLALFLAAIGIYGVLAYAMAQRIHEIGIRMALGAQRTDVMRLVLGQGAKLALIGVGVGALAALGLTRLLASLLYSVSPTDPITFVGVALVLLGVALLACYIPARRAMRVDPIVALRYE